MLLQKRCMNCAELELQDAKKCSSCGSTDLYDTEINISKIFVFKNGSVSAFDEQDKQIPYLNAMLKKDNIEIEN